MKTARIAMTLVLLTVAGCAHLGATGGATGTGSSTNRLALEITVGECAKALRDRLPKTTAGRLSPDDLQQHPPVAPLLTQRFILPAKGRLTQDLKADEFTIHLDLDYQYWTEKNAVNGGVSASSAAGNGLLRPVHWNCFSATMGEPLYLGYVKAGRATYLVVGRFRLATTTVAPTEEER